MKNLNQKATKVFMLLVDGLKEPGDAKKIDNTNGAFMTVHVELIHQNEHGRHYSIAHYYEQNGDLMRDPDVVFLLSAIDKPSLSPHLSPRRVSPSGPGRSHCQ